VGFPIRILTHINDPLFSTKSTSRNQAIKKCQNREVVFVSILSEYILLSKKVWRIFPICLITPRNPEDADRLDSLMILKDRFAKGQITEQGYKKMKEVLSA